VQYENETQAHHVGISAEEDRGGTAGAVGEGEGGEEEIGGLEPAGRCTLGTVCRQS
jgi:hypothetical protein